VRAPGCVAGVTTSQSCDQRTKRSNSLFDHPVPAIVGHAPEYLQGLLQITSSRKDIRSTGEQGVLLLNVLGVLGRALIQLGEVGQFVVLLEAMRQHQAYVHVLRLEPPAGPEVLHGPRASAGFRMAKVDLSRGEVQRSELRGLLLLDPSSDQTLQALQNGGWF